MPQQPVTEYPTPLVGNQAPASGLQFPASGGLALDAGYPLTFEPDEPYDPTALFPAYVPKPEQIVYQAVKDACNSHTLFATDGTGAPLPAQFNIGPSVSLFAGLDPSYPAVNGITANPIPVVRGWPAYPGQVPAIGVAESTSPEDPSGEIIQAGFAGDAYVTDALGNVLATCAYYAEPLHVSVVVELIHTNRDERDRLHDQLRRVIFPLKHLMPGASSQIRDVSIAGEKQDLPLDEQPFTMYVSVFTVEVIAEMLIPTEIVPGGVIKRLDVTPTVTYVAPDTPTPSPSDLNAPTNAPTDIFA